MLKDLNENKTFELSGQNHIDLSVSVHDSIWLGPEHTTFEQSASVHDSKDVSSFSEKNNFEFFEKFLNFFLSVECHMWRKSQSFRMSQKFGKIF